MRDGCIPCERAADYVDVDGKVRYLVRVSLDLLAKAEPDAPALSESALTVDMFAYLPYLTSSLHVESLPLDIRPHFKVVHTAACARRI